MEPDLCINLYAVLPLLQTDDKETTSKQAYCTIVPTNSEASVDEEQQRTEHGSFLLHALAAFTGCAIAFCVICIAVKYATTTRHCPGGIMISFTGSRRTSCCCILTVIFKNYCVGSEKFV